MVYVAENEQQYCTYNWHYIKRMVDRYNATGNENLAIDCLWRIASHADLYTPDELNEFTENGMPDEVWDEICGWLEDEGFEVE